MRGDSLGNVGSVFLAGSQLEFREVTVSPHHPFCRPVLQGLSWVGICKGKIEPLFIGGAPAALPTATLTVQIAAMGKRQSSVLLGHFPLEQKSFSAGE